MAFQLAEAYVQLGQKGYEGLTGQIGKVKGSLTDMVNTADGPLTKAIRESGEEMMDLQGHSDSVVQSMQAIGDVTGVNTTRLAEFADTFSTISSTVENVRGKLDSLKDKTDSFAQSSGSADSKFSGMVGKAGRILGIIGLVGGAAKAVYDWVYKWNLEASGFNDELERSLTLENKLAQERARITQDAIDAASLIENSDKRRIELQKALHQAMLDNDKAQKDMQKRDDERTPGFFGQFGDGKLNEELEPAFERAKVKADATAAAVKALRDEIRGIGKDQQGFKSSLAEELKEEKILLEQGVEALRAYQLEKQGFSKEDAAGFAAAESEIQDRSRQQAEEESIADAFKRQMEELKLRNIELAKGDEAAQRERDRLAGYTEEQQKQLALIREKNRAQEEFNDAAAEWERMRKEDKEKEKSKAEAAETEKSNDAFQKVGLAQLADKMQQQLGANQDSKEQKESARKTAAATQKLAEAAASGGLPVKLMTAGSPIDTPDRRFGSTPGESS